MMAFLPIDTSTATWQRRTLRYLTIYLLLALALVAARYATQHIRPTLRDAQQQEAALLSQRDNLEIRVQAATTPQKVQEWAVQNGMQRFAESNKSTRDLGTPPPDTAPPTPPSSVEVKTQWK